MFLDDLGVNLKPAAGHGHDHHQGRRPRRRPRRARGSRRLPSLTGLKLRSHVGGARWPEDDYLSRRSGTVARRRTSSLLCTSIADEPSDLEVRWAGLRGHDSIRSMSVRKRRRAGARCSSGTPPAARRIDAAGQPLISATHLVASVVAPPWRDSVQRCWHRRTSRRRDIQRGGSWSIRPAPADRAGRASVTRAAGVADDLGVAGS